MSRLAVCCATLLSACTTASDPFPPADAGGVGRDAGPSDGRPLDRDPGDPDAAASPDAVPDGGEDTDLGFEVDAGTPSLPITRDEIVAFVRSGEYTGWRAEAQIHRSSGPHGDVRTFVNDALYTSLKSGQPAHPSGSVAVKELYRGGTRNGWAVDVKGSDGIWTYFEGLEPRLDQFYFRGDGNLCSNCHSGGVDRVLVRASALP